MASTETIAKFFKILKLFESSPMGDPGGFQVFYVWFDAPIGYISITACHTSEWEKWWKNPENVDLYQFMGKDNVPFHSVMFPSTLLGTGENWTLPKTISATEYLNYETGKFSKSNGVGVFGNDAKDTGIPPEVWRYYLLSMRPEVSDTVFTWSGLQVKLNDELVGTLGNFVHRVLSFIAKPSGVNFMYRVLSYIPIFSKPSGKGYGSVIPDAAQAESHSLTNDLVEMVGSLVDEYIIAMKMAKEKEGLKIAIEICNKGNKYLQDSQFWRLYEEDRATCDVVMRTSAGLVYVLALLLEPFMPSFSNKVLNQLNLSRLEISLSDENGDLEKIKKFGDILARGHRIGKPEPLFYKLTNKQVEQYKKNYAGTQTERATRAAAAEKTEVADDKKTKKKKKKQPKQQSLSTSPGFFSWKLGIFILVVPCFFLLFTLNIYQF